MSENLEVRAEILKLARLLGREPASLSYLERVAADDLRRLREQVTEALFNSHLGTLRRLAAASRLLPVAVVAQMGERVFGPLLSARIAGLLEPDRAVEMAARLPVGFLADVAIELDPRRASDVIARIPPDQVAAVTAELAARHEYVTMGRFVGHMPEASTRAALTELDAGAVLQVALVLENKDGLDRLAELLGDERIDEMISTADDAGLGEEALELLEYLPAERREAIVARPELQRRLRARGLSALPPPARARRTS